MSKYTVVSISILFMTIGAFGCTVVTDFPDIDETELYSLEANLANPVVVTLLDNGNATISLTLEEALPETDEGGDSEIAALLGDTVQVTVRSLAEGATPPTADLTQGEPVTNEPSDPGQYQITLNQARTTATIVFRNDTVGGQSLKETGEYEAAIDVRPNSYFAIESFSRDVDISD